MREILRDIESHPGNLRNGVVFGKADVRNDPDTLDYYFTHDEVIYRLLFLHVSQHVLVEPFIMD